MRNSIISEFISNDLQINIMTETKLKNQQEESINLYAIFFKYWVYAPWFVVSVLICLAIATIYLRYQIPVYDIQSAVLIKEEKNQSNRNNNALTAIQGLGMMSMTNNFNNELQILKSQTLIQKVVNQLGLYVSHSQKRSFGYDLPLYQTEPVKVYMSPEEADKLEEPVKFYLDYVPNRPLKVKMEYMYHGKKKTREQVFEVLPVAFPSEIGVITFTPHSGQAMEMVAQISSPNGCAATYAGNLSVEAISKTTTIAQIHVKNTVKQRGIDFIYQLVESYNQDANEEKNEVAQKTADFIEERITIIDRELGSTEDRMAHFKQRSRLTNLTNDAQMALQETAKYEQQLAENHTQISLIEDLANYINQSNHEHKVIPANVGIQDANLAHVINQYNTMVIERKRLLRTSSESNPAVINLNLGIEAMRSMVQTTVSSVLRGLEMTEKNLQRESRKHEGRISDAPTQEKEYMSIARQQEIKANLYTILLQKREENAITLASTASNGRIIEIPMASKSPVSPKKNVYLLAALIVGMALPLCFIYIIDLMKYKIENRKDVEKLCSLPILAELPLGNVQESVRGTIVIHENKNNLMEEAFRILRTNLLFMLKPEDKVIMVTSSQPSDGKSFVAGNLAASLAYLGKKVIIIGLDIRNSGLDKVFGLNGHTLGITNYLSQPEHVDWSEWILPSKISPNLDIFPRGNIPPNPTELVSRSILDELIQQLKGKYDYVILDTAPIAMVTDSSIISRVADLCIYVCRADHTPKAAFSFVNTLKEQSTFCPLAIVINGIDLKKKKNKMDYSYGYKYGYGHTYGYGYGYGKDVHPAYQTIASDEKCL